jgi:YceI-like domain
MWQSAPAGASPGLLALDLAWGLHYGTFRTSSFGNGYPLDTTCRGRGVVAHPPGLRGASLELLSTAPVADGRGALRRGFTATGQIDRTDWGLTWNMSLETGGWLVSEEVQLELEVAVFGPA